MFCILHKILYNGSGAPSSIYQCAITSDRELQFSRCLAIKISVTEFPPYVLLILGDMMWMVRALPLLADTQHTLPLIGCS
jgi:hypothetical protein